MKVVGIVSEYNPFHNGHKYHIEKTRELTNADYIVIIMSGNFTQRGTPAIIDKYERAQMALMNGADLVIELPTIFSCGSAEYFAQGAVDILNGLGVVDVLSFGSECGNTIHLQEIAQVLLNETDAYKEEMKRLQKSGLTYPLARCLSLENTLPGFSEHSDILNHPNNILGMEYCKSIQKTKSSIEPFTFLRIGGEYHQYHLSNNYSSARAIRQSIKSMQALDYIKNQVPENVFPLLANSFQKGFPIFNDEISLMLKYKLLLNEEKGYFEYMDVSEDMSDRITNHLQEFTTFSDFCAVLNSKQVTYSRISRSLLHILLGLTRYDLALASEPENLYARPLGFRDNAAPLLKEIKDKATIPFVSKLADANIKLSESAFHILKKDIFAANVYESLKANKFNIPAQNEYTRNIIHF